MRDPRRTRIAQFAAIRTDADLNPIGEPIRCFCQPADDLLPSPDATLITGITPQQALREGLSEAEFFARMHRGDWRARTPARVGYNSLRFDDEFIRYGLYRNFYDPYEREWRDGNSRWDLLDVMRLAHALRPEGIEWPLREDGAPRFRLEHLAAANGVRTRRRARSAVGRARADRPGAPVPRTRSRGCGTTRCACATSATPARLLDVVGDDAGAARLAALSRRRATALRWCCRSRGIRASTAA